tara:strand:+ start:228 stop:977 length:750 start_codon:yes stop_codon:yes gene_type:complete
MVKFINIDINSIKKEILEKQSIYNIDINDEHVNFLFKILLSKKFFNFTSNIDEFLKSDNFNNLPLLTWPFLDFIASLDLSNHKLFELGSGNSTLLFSKIFNKIESFETDKKFYKQLQGKISKNVDLKLVNTDQLQHKILNDISFKNSDWLLVDFAGKRTFFISKLLKMQEDELPAHIIFDNIESYTNARKLLLDKSYTEIPFWGFKSGEKYITCTSLFLLKDKWMLKASEEYFRADYSYLQNKNSWDDI